MEQPTNKFHLDASSNRTQNEKEGGESIRTQNKDGGVLTGYS